MSDVTALAVLPAPARPAFTLADLRGLVQLGIDAGVGIAGIAEQLHGTILAGRAPLGVPHEGGTRGLTGFVYGRVRGGIRLAGRGVDGLLKRLETEPPAASAASREAVLAAVNGLWGDHLAASGNPLAITMSLRFAGRRLGLGREALAAAFPDAGTRAVVLVHGLCMNDLQWQRQGYHHGQLLAQALDCPVLAVHYNSGLHVSHNGAHLADLLERLARDWPRPGLRLSLVGHSMGGLVARSAIAHAERHHQAWRERLQALVCLGTPHQGALLERAGQLVDAALGASPYLAPFARLLGVRSAGINDLRWGHVRDEDWCGHGAGGPARDHRVPTPLPDGVPVYLVAATTVAEPRGLRHAVLGDGLVTVASAWGEHRDPALALAVPASRKRLVTQAGHWDLLSRAEVAEALCGWLA
ncbi:PGAP1-like alpha/beta domain-containing protein [Rubrivivax gelatinosus]|uniref:Putative hydrolase n=1 Tax=Rubrivivax gelatinosus (strain NBRC 100245 / IL144) TaxID=983917 RepID=I0HP32_RUBGI|nr:alpha/beta hydrolase [Rubrivivax gelatinosus]BAL94769.1 putative hydrolase [Rubrivivax gelatinosus IL144]